ncbi:V8-like Glu-specific endopeptidase [Pannonibacter phragmitetus]|uniref:V8-like Glu-specific endopeptidase n=1 Tax=Pannonibacter phragmitetus TaxID=121719 RepID=A0A378ZT90_9HYPH|nr:serine protease [Pannonibacter phragmitetus]SUB00444.1 V8-like Glu-specific endopeptidase [Pannonibacter phragmitetus]
MREEGTITISELGDKLAEAAAGRVQKNLRNLRRALKYASQGLVSPTETKARIERYLEGQSRPPERQRALIEGHDDLGKEALIGTSDLLSVEFLEAGQLAARAVACIQIAGGAISGTGFLAGPGLLLTNQHVLETPAMAAAATAVFGHEEQKFGIPSATSEYALDPGTFWLADKEHDFALVAVSPVGDTGVPLTDFGWHPLLDEGKILEGHPVSVIQHPQGRPKCIALHNSYFLLLGKTDDEERFCWYTADTERGSSGAPVFSRDWQVVALHHKAVPKTNEDGEILDRLGKPMPRAEYERYPDRADHVANEGIRASRLRRFIASAPLEVSAHAALRDQLVAHWDSPQARSLRARFPPI